MRSLLIGECAAEDVETAIRGALESRESIESVLDLKTLQIGPDTILVAVKARFDRKLTSQETAEEIAHAEKSIREAAAGARFVYLEPE